MLRLLTPGLVLTSALSLLACVTINVYFPAAEAQEAADRIIDQVQGAGPSADAGEQGARLGRPSGWIEAGAAAVLDLLVAPAHAQNRPDIDISTPTIRALVASMEERFSQLQPYYGSGAIGLTRDATIEVRDRNAIPLPDRSKVNKLVADENADRNALYVEIAKANGHPEWQDEIRQTFAQRWIAKARSGWYYRNSEGDWTQKR